MGEEASLEADLTALESPGKHAARRPGCNRPNRLGPVLRASAITFASVASGRPGFGKGEWYARRAFEQAATHGPGRPP